MQVFASLKVRNFRLYFGGMCISLTGTWMQQTAMSWLVYRLSGSVLLLATVTFMAQIPVLLLTPFLSVYADRYDRRKLLLLTQSLSMIQAFLLALLTMTGVIETAHILLLSLFIGCINALDNPVRQAFYPSLVPPEDLGNAIALNSAVINGSRLLGPAIAGFLIGIRGEAFCFLLNGTSYIAVIAALSAMKLPAFTPAPFVRRMKSELQEGFVYVYHHRSIRSLLLLMSVISFFGLPLVTFLPAYVKDILHGHSEMLGGLLSCIGAGSLLAAFYLAARKNMTGLGKVISLSVVLLSTSLVIISTVTRPWAAALLCLPIGFTLITAVATINTLLQTLSDEDKRGRVMGYLAMTFTGISPIGNIVLGYIEKYTGLPAIIRISGFCCLAGALLFEYYLPGIRKAVPQPRQALNKKPAKNKF